MNAIISAEIANQRHAELVAQAAAHRTVLQARQSRRPQAATTARSTRPRPIAAMFQWIAAGQL